MPSWCRPSLWKTMDRRYLDMCWLCSPALFHAIQNQQPEQSDFSCSSDYLKGVLPYRLCNCTQRPVTGQNQIGIQPDETSSDLFRLRRPGGAVGFLSSAQPYARQRRRIIIPFSLFAMYEKNGAEKILRRIYEAKFKRVKQRPYITNDFYNCPAPAGKAGKMRVNG